MRFSEKWGDSVDAAVQLALNDLGLTRDEVNVTVLEEPTRGFFGIGSKLAKVRVEAKEAEKPQPKAEAPEEKKETRPQAPAAAPAEEETAASGETFEERAPREGRRRSRSRSRNRKDRPERREPREAAPKEIPAEIKEALAKLNERPDDLVEQPEHPAKIFLDDLTKEMGLKVGIKVSANENTVYVDIDGEDSGTIIGKRGQTLDAVQYLTSLVVNKGEGGYIRVVIDAEGYREKRESTLEKLALRLADKAARSGRHVRLEPMNPYERKVIHTALQGRTDVTTKSEGEEPYRRVVIEPARKR